MVTDTCLGSERQGRASERAPLPRPSAGRQGHRDFSLDRNIGRHVPRLLLLHPQ